MAFATGVGVSTDRDILTAISKAAADARRELDKPAMVLAFITHSYGRAELTEAAAALADAFPGVPTGGGQVNGITYERHRHDAVFANGRAVAVVAFGGEGVRGAISMRTDASSVPREAGRALVRQATAELGVPAVGGILLGLGLSHMPPIDQPLLDGIRDAGPRLRVTGTGMSGGMQMDGSYDPSCAFVGREVAEHAVVLAVLGGDVSLGFATANGMQSVGPGAFVTKVDGSEILELNGQPAKELVLDLLSDGDPELRAMFEKNPQVMGVERGITLGAPDPEGDFYWCHMPSAFSPRGGVFDVFNPRVGMGLALTKIDRESCMAAVAQAAGMLKQDAAAESFELTIGFSCALRGFTLGPEVAREEEELSHHVASRRHLGIIANGEIGCYRHGRPMFTGWVFALLGAT